MKKVLILTPSVRPLGARRSLVELVRALPSGWEPLVVCPAADGIALELKDLGVSTAVVPQYPWRKATGWLRAQLSQIPRLREITKRFSPQIAHANEFHILPQTLRGIGDKCPATVHVRLSITERQIVNYELNKAARVLCVSKAVADLFNGSPVQQRTEVVYNGVTISGLGTPQDEVLEPLRPWRLDPTKPLVIGLLGLVSDRKNQLVAAEAVALANQRGADVRLVIAGDAFKDSIEYGERLRARLAMDDLRERALWLPFQKNVGGLYRGLDVNLLISKEEGFGRTIIEAGALGIPSIGTRIGGIPELIDQHRTGILLDEGNVEQLAEALVALYQDKASREAMGRAAMEHVHRHFTIEAHANRMVTIWERAAAGEYA